MAGGEAACEREPRESRAVLVFQNSVSAAASARRIIGFHLLISVLKRDTVSMYTTQQKCCVECWFDRIELGVDGRDGCSPAE